MTVEQAERQVARTINLNSLPRNIARIEIARDVLAWMDLKKLLVTRGGYLNGNLPEEDGMPSGPLDLRDVFLHRMPNCQVCAIGACFMAVVARVDEFQVDASYGEIAETDDAMVKKLKPFFTAEELARMESMFELTIIDERNEKSSVCAEFVAWGKFIADEEEGAYSKKIDEARATRMRAMMTRIIATDGAEPITIPDYPGKAEAALRIAEDPLYDDANEPDEEDEEEELEEDEPELSDEE